MEQMGGVDNAIQTARGRRIAEIAERYTNNIQRHLTKTGRMDNDRSEVTKVGQRVYMGLSNG